MVPKYICAEGVEGEGGLIRGHSTEAEQGRLREFLDKKGGKS